MEGACTTNYYQEIHEIPDLKGDDAMTLFKCNTCNGVYEDYYPPDDICLKCKLGIIKVATSGVYVLSTKIVDNPVEAVDMFQKCHI